MLQDAICSVSVDLDTLLCYERIHGLPQGARSGPDPIYTVALPRLLALFARFGIRGTFFVIGRDVEEPAHADILKQALAEGHELANHTYSHPYRLTRLPPEQLEQEIAQGGEAISALMPEGESVCGFRCPGYNTSKEVLAALRKHDYLYDSSVFPCPPYLLARASIIGLMALQGRQSHSMPGSPQALWAPVTPYFPGDDPHVPARQKGAQGGLLEIPMAVLPGLRLPYIATSLWAFPSSLLPFFSKGARWRHKLLNFEWHGIDILDQDDPGLSHLAPYQFDLRVPLAEKMRRFELCLRSIASSHRFAPLREAAQMWSA